MDHTEISLFLATLFIQDSKGSGDRMLKNRFRYIVKGLIAIVIFGLVFCFIQPFFIPKFIKNNAETTVLVNSYSQLEKNSIDILFLGSSQMFRTVDSARLNDIYHLNACNYGASGQSMSITPYYFDEALKSQSPKLIMVEVGCIFEKNSDLSSTEIAWNYAPTPITDEKLESLENILGSDLLAYEHTFLPLFIYHDRWRIMGEQDKEETKFDIDYVFNPDKYNNLYPYGFVDSEKVEKVNYEFNNTNTSLQEIPEESKAAIKYLSEECSKRKIKLLFFKSPAPFWTKGECESVKKHLGEQKFDYIDLNEHYVEISLNDSTDFSDEQHLNTFGAKKTTDYLAKVIPSYLV